MCKKLILPVIVTLALVAGSAQADLVGHWKLDEGSGDVAGDATGNGHDGTLLNGPTWVDGYFDGGLEFSGAQQKVDIPYSPDLNPEEAFTLSFWANVDPNSSGHRSPVTSRDDSPQRGYIIYVEPGNTWQFWMGVGSGWNNTAGPAVALGEWTYVAATYANSWKKFYINGNLEAENAATIDLNTEELLRIGGGATEGDGNYFFAGLLDDVRVYNHALSEAQMAAVMAGEPYPYAAAPKPGDGAMVAATEATLQWSPGEIAVSHNVYLGTDAEAVANATPDDADLFLGSTTDNSLALEALDPGATYYWRVDAIDESNPDSPWKGEVWSFWVQPDIAWAPSPTDGASYIDPNQDLTWELGLGTLFHTVYLGESFDEVNDATAGGMMTTDAIYDPATLELGKTYYWRVDEFTGLATNKGEVWSFTTIPDIPVTDESLLAWWMLDEGEGTTVVDWSGHGHHGTLAGDAQWQDGCLGGAVGFDGSGDYVDLGTPEDLHLTQNYTYTAWFKVGRNISGNSGVQYLLCIGSRSDLVFGVEDGVGVNGDLSLHYYDTAPGFHAVGVGQTVWGVHEWHAVAGTRDETGHKIYLDGKLQNSDTNTNEDNFGGAMGRMISLGGRAWTGHQYYNGLIDDVRIYNRALTAEEVAQVSRGDLLRAWSPDPVSGSVAESEERTTLSWLAGDTAFAHYVYLGTDADLVAASDPNLLLGMGAETSIDLAEPLIRGTTYYWKLDEMTADGTVIPGLVWSFTLTDVNTENWQDAVAAAEPNFVATHVEAGVYDIGALGGEITYEFVVRANPDETEVSMALIGRIGFGDTTAALKYEQYNNTGNYGATHFGVMDYDFGVANALGEYTHLVFVSSEDASTTALYVNGVYQASVDGPITLSGIVGIGYATRDEEGSAFIDPFDGTIFGVAIYSAALSDEEIQAHSDAYFKPAVFAEDFEAYEAGSDLHGQGGWKGWDNTTGAGAPASDLVAVSGAISAEIGGGADLVHEFDVAGGVWVLSAMQYIPSGTTGENWFILLNQYSDAGSGGPDKDWSLQYVFNLGTGVVTSQESGGTAEIVYDQWVELMFVIDLDNNTADGYYNGALVGTQVWDDTGHATIGAVDLYGAGASSIYYDDIVIAPF